MTKEVNLLVSFSLTWLLSKAVTQVGRRAVCQLEPFECKPRLFITFVRFGFPLVNYFYVFGQGHILSSFCSYYATIYHSHLYHTYFNGPHYRNRIPLLIGWPLKLSLLSIW